MSLSKAVSRLHRDLQSMRQAHSGEAKAAAAAKKATAAEQTALGKIATQQQGIVDQFQQAGAPLDPATAGSLLNQMFSLGRQQVQTKDRFDGQIAQDRKVQARDHRAYGVDHKHALRDLRPAEYGMSLKATNRVRNELGLRSLKHALRAPSVQQTVGGQVGRWIAQAQTILEAHGLPLSKMNAKDINTIIKFESGGNPSAVNNWDSNAAAGHPSKGLMQTIGPTFNSYKLPGHHNILNPIDNIIAGVRYAVSRYGSISNVPGIRAVHAGGHYVGY